MRKSLPSCDHGMKLSLRDTRGSTEMVTVRGANFVLEISERPFMYPVSGELPSGTGSNVLLWPSIA